MKVSNLNKINTREFSSSKSFEVEIKFHSPLDIKSKLISSGAKFIGEKRFTDIYFDTNDFVLTTKDIWFRKRGDDFECKVGERDESGVDRYQEITNPTEIRRFLSAILPTKDSLIVNAELKDYMDAVQLHTIASITTRRERLSFEEFMIDLDEADFDYRVGEVELMVDDQEQSEEASKKIVEFCKRFDLKTTPPIQGKVLEYIDRFRPLHYEQLQKCGLIQRKLLQINQ
eukprot:TRINITY_DN3504_c0_g1_i1.p1 TRINITY_DN3504_c0_g1~~TRINITY_DN3504_c0_g1_i1.p1  ORF type:complete len:246 (-),score=52.59 TRINITY_DN3504_c0_g1_i1:2-688(-)